MWEADNTDSGECYFEDSASVCVKNGLMYIDADHNGRVTGTDEEHGGYQCGVSENDKSKCNMLQ